MLTNFRAPHEAVISGVNYMWWLFEDGKDYPVLRCEEETDTLFVDWPNLEYVRVVSERGFVEIYPIYPGMFLRLCPVEVWERDY